MVTFNAKIFAQNSVDNKIYFYTSADGNTWTQISSTHDTPVSTGNGWYRANFTPSSSLPVGTRYLKVEFSNDITIYSPQLSSISIPYKYKYLGQRVWIKSVANNKYLTTQTGKTNAPLEAVSATVGTSQQYVIEDAGEGYIAFKAVGNGKYLSVSTDTSSPLQAKSDTIGIYERFWITDAGSGYYALHALVNDMYISMNDSDPNDAIQVTAKAIQSAEKFQLGE